MRDVHIHYGQLLGLDCGIATLPNGYIRDTNEDGLVAIVALVNGFFDNDTILWTDLRTEEISKSHN